LPDKKQNGAAVVAHARGVPAPLSPSHGSQLDEAASHTGVAPEHWLELRQPTHKPLLVLHTGVVPEHCESSAQPAHTPGLEPLLAQTVERQTVLASAAVHGPSPFWKPHSSSFGSHTPLAQTSAPAALVQVPSRVGFVCGASVGTGVALGSVGRHAFMLSLHQLPVGQSASALQPPAGSHRPLLLQAPERQTVAPLALVHGPSLTA
jgi:hypothetical protein